MKWLAPTGCRTRIAFAWRPVQIGKHIIWLRRYAVDEQAARTAKGRDYWAELRKREIA